MAKDSFFGQVRKFCSGHPVFTGLVLMAFAALMLAWATMAFLSVWTHHGQDSTVPEIKDMAYSQAAKTLRDAHLQIEISDSVYDTSRPAGTIIESWPKAGSQVKRGRKVYVSITSFSPRQVTISMPVTGVSVRQATSYLTALGINGIRIQHVPSDYPNLVEKAYFNGRPIGVGSEIPVDAKIVLEVGTYVEPQSSDESYDDDLTAEDAVYEDLAGSQSVYVDDESL